jgi:hypothetical protein
MSDWHQNMQVLSTWNMGSRGSVKWPVSTGAILMFLSFMEVAVDTVALKLDFDVTCI